MLGFALYAQVMRENRFLSRTAEIQRDQKAADTGLYGVVQHPMYPATLLLFFSMPLMLGSLYGFLLLPVGYPPLIVWRILDEERTLQDGLSGYRAYMKKVTYRLIPLIW